MTYTAKSEETLAKEGLLLDGEYDSEIVDTSDKPSKKGNAMFTLKHHVFDTDGNARVVYDYIAMGNNFGERKLRHAADACGLIETYNTSNLKAADFMGRSCKVKIKIQEGDADYPLPKNQIIDYVVPKVKESLATGAMPPATGADEDEVPF